MVEVKQLQAEVELPQWVLAQDMGERLDDAAPPGQFRSGFGDRLRKPSASNAYGQQVFTRHADSELGPKSPRERR
jgi:hypothetical protein